MLSIIVGALFVEGIHLHCNTTVQAPKVQRGQELKGFEYLGGKEQLLKSGLMTEDVASACF